MKPLSFSVVINTYNRGDFLGDALKGLEGLDYLAFEVVVVNGPSTDNTEEVLAAWNGKIKVARCAEANLSISRNVGIAESRGDIVAFIDDDAVPHPQWLKVLAQAYGDERVGGAGGFTIDNTGVRFQCRKTICDRYGNAHHVSPFFDERALNFAGTPYYPSLLGTNSSFRRDILHKIGGFDHTFAYMLDETDVCLRIVDAGYHIVYEADALVFHQFAPSHVRDQKRIARTLYPSAVSKAYFVMRHGGNSLFDAAQTLVKYEKELLDSNSWFHEEREITLQHKRSLDLDVTGGVRHGVGQAKLRTLKPGGDLSLPAKPPAFRPFPTMTGLRIALVSRGFPPDNDTGIPRWTSMLAEGLAARGHQVHVLTEANDAPSVRLQNGFWLHRIVIDAAAGDQMAAASGLPHSICGWSAAVRREVETLKSFGLQVVSFPIWDIEGISVVDDADIATIMSLHTSYLLAMPFKQEWSEKPLFEHFAVRPVIAEERRLLAAMPVILANSSAIVRDMTAAYKVDFSDRMVMALHGTRDPVAGNDVPAYARVRDRAEATFTFVGRFEPRKGFDIVVRAFTRLVTESENANCILSGDVLTADVRKEIQALGSEILLNHPRVKFAGKLSREELDALYLRSDTIFMPSRYESFGLVAIEAMAAGVPVVALACGGLNDIILDGETGYLVPAGDGEVQQCAERLLELAGNAELRIAIGKAGRARFLKVFTVATMAEFAEAAFVRAHAQHTGGTLRKGANSSHKPVPPQIGR